MDSDIPPPLDDKLKDIDFDLDEEEIIIEDEELPELPTDFNVFSSASTSDNISHSNPPPFTPFVSASSPPPDIQDIAESYCDQSESFKPCDVAKEKESFKIDGVVSQQHLSQSTADDNKSEAGVKISYDEDTLKNVQVPTVKSDDDADKKTNKSSSVLNDDDENIPIKGDLKSDEKLHINEKDSREEQSVDQSVVEIAEISVIDNDFKDFVEANSTELAIESSGAFKTEESLGRSSEFDDFTGLASNDDIPEPIPELKLDDDDDDDFNDFETAIPANRQVEQVQTVTAVNAVAEEPAEIQFEADFSGFNAFNEPAVEDSFEEFQDFKASGFSEDKQLVTQSQDDEDDDDFGDFSDFTQAPAPVTILPAEVQPAALVKPTNVNGIIDMMFPPSSSSSEEQKEAPLDGDYTKEQQVIKSDNFVNKFNDFDSTLALGYLYNNSKTSKSLVTALGIDTRNIVSRNCL